MTEFFYCESDRTTTQMDMVLDPDILLKAHPDYYGPRFQAIADIRKMDDGTLHKGNEFRRVASFVNIPLLNNGMRILDPDFMKDKKKFYAFLDRNLEYCTYDRRNRGAMTAGDRAKLPLSVLGIDYPGGPATVEDFEVVEVTPEPALEATA